MSNTPVLDLLADDKITKEWLLSIGFQIEKDRWQYMDAFYFRQKRKHYADLEIEAVMSPTGSGFLTVNLQPWTMGGLIMRECRTQGDVAILLHAVGAMVVAVLMEAQV